VNYVVNLDGDDEVGVADGLEGAVHQRLVEVDDDALLVAILRPGIDCTNFSVFCLKF
jgi:hypothetical protein